MNFVDSIPFVCVPSVIPGLDVIAASSHQIISQSISVQIVSVYIKCLGATVFIGYKINQYIDSNHNISLYKDQGIA